MEVRQGSSNPEQNHKPYIKLYIAYDTINMKQLFANNIGKGDERGKKSSRLGTDINIY